MKNIIKLGVAKFKVSTPNVTNSEIEMDFNPIIKQFKLEGNYTLIHWQAKPKGFREWGIYSSVDDSYKSIAELAQNVGGFKTLQLDDQSASTLPSAVLYSSEAKCTCINDKAVLGTVAIADLL